MKRRYFLLSLLALPLAFVRRSWTNVIRTQVNPDLTQQFEQVPIQTVYGCGFEGGVVSNGKLIHMFDLEAGKFKRV